MSIGALERLLPTYERHETPCADKDRKTISDPQAIRDDYLISHTWAVTPDRPTKYLMLRLAFNESFASGEIDTLVRIFRKLLEITKGYDNGRNLWGETDYAFHKVIVNPTRTLDWSKPILGACTFSPSTFPAPQAPDSDAYRLYSVFMAVMCNYKPGERDDYCPSATRYVPIYLSRYQRNREADGSWQLATAPLRRLVETKVYEISVNVTALTQGGLSDRKWAAGLFHEMLHNIGYDHPDGYEDRRQFMLAAQDAFYACGQD